MITSGAKKIASYSLGPEAQGKAEYVDTSIASYLRYPCQYCLSQFYLVDPYSRRSGGCIQPEILRNRTTNERIPTNRIYGMCILCFHDIMQRKQQESSRKEVSRLIVYEDKKKNRKNP
jgi:hypothetical protein